MKPDNSTRAKNERLDAFIEERDGIFRYHNCYRCSDGLKPCVHRDGPNQCEFPHAKND